MAEGHLYIMIVTPQLVDLGTGQCSLGCINLTYTFTITPKATIMSPISADQHNILFFLKSWCFLYYILL